MCQILHPPKPFATVVRELASLNWEQHQGRQEHQAFLTVVPSNHRHLVTNGPHRSLICKVPKAPCSPFGRQKTLSPWQQCSEISWVPLPVVWLRTTGGVAGTFSVILRVGENDPVGHTIGELGDSSVTHWMPKGKSKNKLSCSLILSKNPVYSDDGMLVWQYRLFPTLGGWLCALGKKEG